MKLHLPKNLRSALLFAVLAISAATPSFAAVTPWVIQNWDGYNETAKSVTVGSSSVVDIALNQSWNTNWSFFFTVDAASLKNEAGTKILTLLGIKMQKSNGDTYLAEGATMSNGANNLALQTWTQGGGTGSITIPDSGDITFVLTHRQSSESNNLSLAVYNSATSTTPSITLYSPGAQNFSAIVSGVVFGGKGNDTYKADSSNHATFQPDNTVGSYAIKKAGYSFGSTNIAADVTTFNNILTWDGSGGNNWSSDASWSKYGTPELQTYTENASVIFATEGANVTLDADASAAAVAIGKNTTFNLSSHNLTVGNLSVDGGSKLSVTGGGELNVNSLENYSTEATQGIVYAENGTSVKLTGIKIANTTVEGTLKLEGSSSVTLRGTVTLDSVVNDLSGGGDYHYAFVGSGTVDLTFTGESVLNQKSTGASNNNSKIGLSQDSSITIASGASLTTSAILNSVTATEDKNASLTVQSTEQENGEEVQGKLYLRGDSYVRSLHNEGMIESSAKIGSYRNITNTGTLKAGTLEINHAGDYTTSSLGGTVEVGTLQLNRGTATVTGKLAVNTSITGGTIDATASSVTFNGTGITNTTIKGTLNLTGNSRITLGGTVVLDSVVNNLTGNNDNTLAFYASNAVSLTFTGTSDLTNGRTNKASGIALRDGTITVGKGDGTEATLTTAAIQITTGEAANYNASVVVNGGGTLNLVKVASNDTAHTFVDTLTNHGTVRAVTTNETDEVVAKKNIHVYANVTNDGSLKAGTLKIRNATPQDVKTLTSELGGTVEVDTLTLVGGTTDITGAVTSGRVEANSATVTLSGSGGTLTIGSAAAGGTLTARANSGNGTVKNATIAANSIAGANAQTLGELVSLNVEFAAAVNVSNVTMSNVALKAAPDTNGTVTYTNAKAVATTMGGAAAPALYTATLSDTPDTLTAMAVQEGGIASGTLIIDVTKDLIAAHYGRSLEWKFLDQVTLGADFKIALGDVLMEMVNDGLPEVWLTVDNGESIQLTTANVNKITTDAAAGGLLAGTTSPVDVTLTVKNIPEPTTATLSLLALAALAARRRRKK